MVRNAGPKDADQICAIYNYYIENTVITFEEESLTGAEIAARMKRIQDHLPYIVYAEEDSILGYAYAAPWKERSAYRRSVEATVYLKNGEEGRGIGTELFSTLIDELRRRDVHAVVSGIALPNEASRALHEKFGFRKVAHFPEVGIKFGRWVDVGYWQLLL